MGKTWKQMGRAWKQSQRGKAEYIEDVMEMEIYELRGYTRGDYGTFSSNREDTEDQIWTKYVS